MKKLDLEKLLQNGLPEQSPDFWDKIQQANYIDEDLPRVKKHVPWCRYAVAAACMGLTVLVGAQMALLFRVNCASSHNDLVRNSTVFTLPQQEAEAGMVDRIIDTVDDAWKQKYPDIEITNEYLGADVNPHKRTVILFGSLKSDSRQGVAEVISTADGVITDGKRFLSPEKNGALTVTEPGSGGSGIGVVDQDGIRWIVDTGDGFHSTDHIIILPQINHSSYAGKIDTEPQIIDNVEIAWKTSDGDITITNGWLSAQWSSGRTIVLCGSLKSDPKQGVADVIYMSNEGMVVEERFLCPQKSGALKVNSIGSKDKNMSLIDENEVCWNFHTDNGFNN